LVYELQVLAVDFLRAISFRTDISATVQIIDAVLFEIGCSDMNWSTSHGDDIGVKSVLSLHA